MERLVWELYNRLSDWASVCVSLNEWLVCFLLPYLIGHRLLQFSFPQSGSVPVPVAGTSAMNR